MDYQRLILCGNATEEAKIEQPEDKTAYADFTIGVSRNQEETNFFPVRVFGKLTESAAKLKKGTRVLVEGRIDVIRFTSEDGQARTTVRVLANGLVLLT